MQIVPDPGHETDIKIRLLNTTNTLSAIIHISDVSSKTIAVKPIMFSPSLQSFMPSVRAGVYFLIIKTETSTSVVRVVVQ